MLLLWVTLLVLHQGYTLVPVTIVHFGENATFTCVLSDKEWNSEQIHWYKQSAGDTLKLIVRLRKFAKPEFAPGFSESRFEVNADKNINHFNLTISRTIQEDEGMYHCAMTANWIHAEWSGIYLLVKGNTQRTSNYTIVQGPTVSDPVHPGDSVNLQCSVLSDSEDKMCPGGGHSVYWFRAGSDKSHPDIIYTDGNGHDGCDKRSDSQKSCVYHFSKNVSSSDAWTYNCAVATCGEILFGNGTKEEKVQTTDLAFNAMPILIICLVISVVGNIVLICHRNKPEHFKGMKTVVSEVRHDNSCQRHDITEADDKLNYAALNFSGKTMKDRKKRYFAEDTVYSQVTC